MEIQPTIKPLQSEIDKVRDDAIKSGQSPDAAEDALRRKLKSANARIQEKQSEEALKMTGEFFNKNKLN